MADKIKVKFVKAYGLNPVGGIAELDEPIAKLLIHGGRAVAVDGEEPEAKAKKTPKSKK